LVDGLALFVLSRVLDLEYLVLSPITVDWSQWKLLCHPLSTLGRMTTACGKKTIIGESENVKRDCGVLVGAFGGSRQSITVLATPVSDFFLPQAV